MIVIKITETGRNSLKEQASIFNHETIYAKNRKEAKEKISEHYGRMPNKRNKIYIDTEIGESKEIGFTYSFWNRDISHNSKHWFQTDWITVVERTDTPILWRNKPC